ncbi:MAG: leucine-rich repeat domain-containing protein [Clostridia bacterium]|nr:leucine-rich repeat domain-containing protein [Clostridia bacterium]
MQFLRRLTVLCMVLCGLLTALPSFADSGLPASLTEIEEEAFAYTPITELTLPATLKTIGPRAFAYSQLRFLRIPPSVTSIDQHAFLGTPEGFYLLVTRGSYAESWCKPYSFPYLYNELQTPSVTAQSVSMQGDKYLYVPYSVMDCQAFVERCLKDAGLYWNLAGSNAWYRQMTWTGSPEECIATFGYIPVGAFLYILKQDGGEPDKYKPDGLGNASHIGIYIGRKDGAIHSSYSKGGVFYSKFSGSTIPNGGWNRVGLWYRLDYGPAVNLQLAIMRR